ncbi:MAG: ABC transporter ATP-binding protein [Bacteroidota bacterium]
MIRTEGLRKVYTTDEVETTALANVTLDIKTGEFIAIMGPSGCGKSTLLNILGLLDQPSGGQFVFDGTDVSGAGERRRADLRRGTLGFVFQSFNLIDELTVYENVELPLLYLSISSKERKERTEAALDRVGMAHRRDHFPQQLSGGQQQRVAIARAVVASPQLILADEPTGNLDSTNGDEVMKLLSELNEAGATIVMVTHSPADAEFAHRVINLFDGQVVSEHFMEKEYALPHQQSDPSPQQNEQNPS